MARTQIEEGDQHGVIASYRNKAGGLTTPQSVRYRLDCQTTATEIISWTDAAALSEVQIDIDSQYNAIINNANEIETKCLTVQANYGLPSQKTQRHVYDVVNNHGYA